MNRQQTLIPLFLSIALSGALRAQTFTTLTRFDGTNGANPQAGLVQATNGNLYGTTYYGGATDCAPFGCGTVFKISTTGTLSPLHSFCSESGCTDGENPSAGLVQATNGYLYGTTIFGGANSEGTVFKITPSGALTTLYSFCPQADCADGRLPYAGLVQATNGYLYGTTESGGANGGGTVFRITPSGTLTTLYSFCPQSQCPDGEGPLAGLVQDTNGYLYGTTTSGGVNGYGTVFKITPSGTLTTLYSFCSQPNCTDGEKSYAALIQATNGDLYGTTYDGGANGTGGTVFRITPSGTLTTLHSFCSEGTNPDCTDGENPEAGLFQGTDGNLYGTTSGGGANGVGTVFKITPSGTLTTLYSFCPGANTVGCTDGEGPLAGLVQDTNGTFYGTTSAGGATPDGLYDGVVFSLSVGLGPFVETQPASGKVGEAVKILGTDLTGATSVTFNGTAAALTVVQPSEISTTVPTGATTGTVEVVTPGGTLSSNVPFRVLP